MKKRSLLIVFIVLALAAVAGYFLYTGVFKESLDGAVSDDAAKNFKTDIVAATSYTLLDPTNVKIDLSKHTSSTPTLNAGEVVYFTAEMNGTLPANGSIKRNMETKFSTVRGDFSSPAKTITAFTTIGNKIASELYYTDGMTPGTTYYFCVQFGMNNDNSYTGFDATQQTTSCVPSSDSFTIAAVDDPAACATGSTCSVGDGKTKCKDATAVKCDNETATAFTCSVAGSTCTQYCAVGSTCSSAYVCKSEGVKCANADGTATCYAKGTACPVVATTSNSTTTDSSPVTDVTANPATTSTETKTETQTKTEIEKADEPVKLSEETKVGIATEDSTTVVNDGGTSESAEEKEEVASLTAEVGDYINKLEREQKKFGASAKLEEVLKNLRDLKGQDRRLLGGARKVSAVLRDARDEAVQVVRERKTEVKKNMVSQAVTRLEENVQKVKESSVPAVVDDKKVALKVADLQATVVKIKQAQENGDEEKVAKLVGDAQKGQDQLSKWLKTEGVEIQSAPVAVSDILVHEDEKIAAKMEKLAFGTEVMFNEKLQETAIKVAVLSNRFSGDFARKVALAVENITAVADPSKRDAVTESKKTILSGVEEVENILRGSALNSLLSNKVKTVLEQAATVNWCGDQAEFVKSRVNNIKSAIKAGYADVNEIGKFEMEIADAAKENVEECYKKGISTFRMPLHEWYAADAEWNAKNGFVKGYSNPSGKSTGYFGEADAATREEALAMMMRIFGVAEGDRAKLRHKVSGVSSWSTGYVNGAKDAGVKIDWTKAMNKPISRIETADMIAEFLLVKGLIKELPKTTSFINTYADKNVIRGYSAKRKGALELLTDYGIFQGQGDGRFAGNSSLLRSEFGALNRRIVENFIGDPDGI
ncbi:hypothetical protein HYW82_04580 [Candidatus Peregrinibacteria bacterium]|nr:hypothetical protein [Candidatus Peregrinibacteria bacterium]